MGTTHQHVLDTIGKLATAIFKPSPAKVIDTMCAAGHDPFIAQSYLEDIVADGRVRVNSGLRLSLR